MCYAYVGGWNEVKKNISLDYLMLKTLFEFDGLAGFLNFIKTIYPFLFYFIYP
jgi:hypothetical protein